jgi:hypothetical protein
MATETLTTTTTAVAKAGERVVFPYASGQPAGTYSASGAVLKAGSTTLTIGYGISFERDGVVVTPAASCEIPAGVLTLTVSNFASGPVDVVTVGSVSRGVGEKLFEVVSVVDFKTPAISWATAFNAAIQSGRFLNVPPGDYLLDAPLTKTDLANFVLFGQGARLILAPGVNFSLLDWINSTDVRISGLRFKHDRTQQTGGHCIRLSGATRLTIEDCVIEDAFGYGIGAQVGTFKDFRLSGVSVYNCGEDSIDLKNKNNNNEGIIYNNLVIDTNGLNGGSGKAGIDIRGPASISNVQVFRCGTGIRFRATDANLENGLGGHRSSLTGFVIDQGASATGVSVDAENVSVSNGTVKGGSIAVSTTAGSKNAVISNVVAENAAALRAFEIVGPDTSLVNCIADGGAIGFRFYAASDASRCVAKNMTSKGFQMEAGATGVSLFGCKQINCATPISDFSSVAQIVNSPTLGLQRIDMVGLPTTAPTAGSNLLWVDTAAGNALKRA